MEGTKSEAARDCCAHSLPIIDETNGIMKTTRFHSPSHYVWRIKSYSSLLESKWEKIESGNFEVDGHKWKLTFYPNGDLKQNGDGYISLYLSVLDTEKLPLSWTLFVKFKFIVFDQIHDKYLVIQDVNESCRFHRMRTEWGFAQLLPLDDFKKSSNGYLHDDCCVLGVDISVIKAAILGESFSVVKPLTRDNSYTFKIENFSTINEKYVDSKVFTIGDMKWKLRLYPNQSYEGKTYDVSLHVFLVLTIANYNSKVYAKCSLRMIDQAYGNHHELTFDCGFDYIDHLGTGSPKFISLSDLKNASKGYLVNDTIIAELQIDYLSTVEHFS